MRNYFGPKKLISQFIELVPFGVVNNSGGLLLRPELNITISCLMHSTTLHPIKFASYSIIGSEIIDEIVYPQFSAISGFIRQIKAGLDACHIIIFERLGRSSPVQ